MELCIPTIHTGTHAPHAYVDATTKEGVFLRTKYGPGADDGMSFWKTLACIQQLPAGAMHVPCGIGYWPSLSSEEG